MIGIHHKRDKSIGAKEANLHQHGIGRETITAGTTTILPPRRYVLKNLNVPNDKLPPVPADYWLIAMGFAAAIASAGFAAIMINQNVGPDLFKGALQSPNSTQALHVRRHNIGVGNASRRTRTSQTIDYNATGSISMHSSRALSRIAAGRSGEYAFYKEKKMSFDAAKTTGSYVLRFVHNQTALLQHGDGFLVARQGMILPGVGKVLSIEQRGNKWNLMTSAGVLSSNHK